MKEYRFKEITDEILQRIREYDIKVTMESLSKEEVDEFRNFVVEMSRRPQKNHFEPKPFLIHTTYKGIW